MKSMSKKRKPKPVAQSRIQEGVNDVSLKRSKPPIKDRHRDEGDDTGEMIVLRLDTRTTLTARDESGSLRKVFVRDAKAYMPNTKHEFRLAKNGSVHEIGIPVPVKKIMPFEEYESGQE
jgi:hypothetical protein